MAVLKPPLVSVKSALTPMAVLKLLLLLKRALTPTAVLKGPVVSL